MDVSIIIVAWNVRQLLQDCVESVYRETSGVEFEIIYVDNGSEDGSADMVESSFSDVRVIRNEQNLGFIKANNQGIKIAKGRYVLLLNSDTIILDNAIARTVEFADKHPEAAVVGCRVLNADGSLQRNAFRFYSNINMLFLSTYLSKLFPTSKIFGRERYGDWNFDSVREVNVIVGCFSLVRRKAIDEVGLMDEALFVYGDDLDWCYRFVKHGWKVMFTPDARIIHLGGQTTKKSAVRFQQQLFGAILTNVKKHYSKEKFWIAKIVTSLFFFLRAPYWLIVAAARKDERGSALERCRGYLRGGIYSIFDWEKLLIEKN